MMIGQVSNQRVQAKASILRVFRGMADACGFFFTSADEAEIENAVDKMIYAAKEEVFHELKEEEKRRAGVI